MKYEATGTTQVVIEGDPGDIEEATERCFTDDWAESFYDFEGNSDEVIRHWVHNALRNGTRDVSDLDGWGDMVPGQVTLNVLVDIDSFDVEVGSGR